MFFLLLAGCKKKPAITPDYGIYGLHDISIVNSPSEIVTTPISVKYENTGAAPDEVIGIKVSGLPANIAVDTGALKASRTPFSTSLDFYDTSGGAIPGVYIITLTTEGTISNTKTYRIRLTITDPPPCTSGITGRYHYCYSYYTGVSYTDSVYNDPSEVNKVWFTNFNNTGVAAYGLLNCYTMYLDIPAQVIKGVTYQGGNVCKDNQVLSLNVYAGTTGFAISMH